jgi:hypothetical protein
MDIDRPASVPPRLYRGPQTLCIQPTFQCSAQCADCGTFSSPYDKTTLGLEIMLSAIDQAKTMGFANVVFAGGEATIRWEMLLKGIEHAHRCSLPARLVTNGYWATTPDIANARTAALIKAGLDEINFSTGDEHVRFVPAECVINAIVAAVSHGLPTHVMVELRSERKVTKNTITDDPRIRSLPAEQQQLLGFTESPWMPVDPGRVEAYADGIAASRENLADRVGCDSVLQTYIVQADGRIGACCGLGLRIIPELNVARTVGNEFLASAVTEAESDFLKLWIHTHGPEKILAWAAEKDPSIQWEDMYAHRCQACLRLYKDPTVREVVREHYHEMLAEVMQAHWLDSKYLPHWLAKSPQPLPAPLGL